MSATITLPSMLRIRLAALHQRLRLVRAVRDLGLLVVVLGLFAAAAVLADHWLDLPALTRQILLSLWFVLGAGLLLRSVVVPLCRRIDTEALAAVIEEKYPVLGERLTSAVELAGTSEDGHGSPLLIALLLEETAARSEGLDFRPAVPSRRAGVVVVLAVLTGLLLAAPALVWPQPYRSAPRFFRPWNIAPVAAPYDIAVTSGDVIAARGRAVPLSARVTPRDDKIALPVTAMLVVVESSGKETRQAMPRAENGDFMLAYKVLTDVSYRIEAGGVVSDSYRVTAITPVELAAESPIVTVTPPAYARSVKEEETFHGLVDLSALRHSEVRFDFHFTRPAVAAYLEFRRDPKGSAAALLFGSRRNDNVVRHPLPLSADRRAATFTMPALKEGKYRLILEAEQEIRTELPGGTILVQLDQPPSVPRFAGKEELRSVLPYERIPLEIEATDDIAVVGVELEYRINDGKAVRQQLDLKGGNSPSAIARHVFELAGKVKEDDRFSYRFRVRDNLPKEFTGPHVIVYPADRWLTMKIARRGTPLKEQEILGQRDEINRRLQAIREALLQEKRGVYKVQQETRNQMALVPEEIDRVKQVQRANRANQKALREVAQFAGASPTLQPVAALARDVADEEMQKSQQALEQVPRQPSPADRTRKFWKADEQLDSAVKRLEELKKTNDRLSQERLDQAKLEMLAEREKHLAEQAAELAAKHPVLDPKARALAEKLKREQAEAAQELERLAQKSDALKQALQQAREEQARQLSTRARELAQAQRDLTRAEAETDRQRSADRLADLARQQQQLAEQEAKLAQETRPSAPVAKTKPLKPEEAQQAADALKQGNPAEALRHQENAANDLERLAQAFEQAVKVSADPKEAARQLEQAEKALRQRVQEETARKDSKQPLNERLKPLEQEQRAIRKAAEQLSVPPSHAEANKLRQQIGERAAQAAEAIQKQDAPRAQAKMEETKNLLHRLSDVLPNLDQRRQQARREVERLRRQQEEIAQRAEQIKKDDPSAVQRQAEASRRQAESAEALSKMDTPNQEARRARATEALDRALADLLDGRREDVPASQQEAKRQLERLHLALRGEKPSDERARELAGKQRELAQKSARIAADAKAAPQQKQELQRQQQQLADQARNLSAPEAPQHQREAAEAVRRAAQATQAQPTSAETRKRMDEAARKLDDLARQLAGEESDAARAERLAQRQAEAAAEAERQSGKPATPEAQRRQQEIVREAREVRGGDEAQQEKQRGREALKRAEQAPAKEQALARRQAADALRDLADRLAGRNDAAAKANYLAQQQRDLARAAANGDADKKSATEAKKAATRQADLKRQLERLDSKAAPQAAKEAAEKMRQAAAALEQAKSPREAKAALTRAAESAEKLAEQLGKAQAANKPADSSGRSVSAKPANPSPRQMAKQMAAEQRQLAQATRKAANAPSGQAGKETMKDLARQQSELNRRASRLPANQAQRGLEQARTAMNKAEQALSQRDAARAQRKQNEAADALERLAQQLPAQVRDRRDVGPTPIDRRDAGPTGLPSKAQSEQARQLARQQRELRDALRRETRAVRNQRPVVTENPVENLARQQAKVARQAADLARNVGQEQGEKAAVSRQAERVQQSARQAARQIQTGALPQAQQAGQQTAEQLGQLAAQLARTPRRENADAADPLLQARQLEQRQKEINRRLQPLRDDARAQAAQQQAQQRQLQQEAGELRQQFQRLTQQARTSWPMQSALQRATGNSQQAQQAMQQARQQAQQGASAAEKQSQERAAQALDQAARAASEAAKPSPQASAKAGAPKSGRLQAGEAVAKAGQQMAAAQGQLQQGQPAQAQSSMRQAAQSLAQAASRMAANPQPPGQPGRPIGLGRQDGGLPDLSAYGLDKSAYAGKSWGELPGELRTKIVQDMKTRYGEDYARMIKYYFEKIASTSHHPRD